MSIAGPKYIQIVNYYSRLIGMGKMAEGEQMPTEQEICDLFGVSRITVRNALNKMVYDGYIYKVQGKGSFVSTKKADMQLNRLAGFTEEMRDLGLQASTTILENKIEQANEEIATALGVEHGQKVYKFIRLRCANGLPMAIEHVHLSFQRFPNIGMQDLSASFYDLLREHYSLEPSWAKQSIWADSSSKHESTHLQIPQNSPVLHIRRITYGSDNLPFEYVESSYRGDKYAFNVTMSAR